MKRRKVVDDSYLQEKANDPPQVHPEVAKKVVAILDAAKEEAERKRVGPLERTRRALLAQARAMGEE